MVNVLTGGKVAASAVKFSRFYLIMDASGLSMNNQDPWQIMKYYKSFIINLKKSFAATKGGEASFKIMPDGSFFNANATIAESFKMIEDAITASGAPEKVFTIGLNADGD